MKIYGDENTVTFEVESHVECERLQRFGAEFGEYCASHKADEQGGDRIEVPTKRLFDLVTCKMRPFLRKS